MTYKEVFLSLMENNLPQEITFKELPDRIIILYGSEPFVIEVGNDDDAWARLVRHLILAGISKNWELHKNLPPPQEYNLVLKETTLTPTEQIRQNYKPKGAPDETGQPPIERPITKNPL